MFATARMIQFLFFTSKKEKVNAKETPKRIAHVNIINSYQEN